MSAAAALAATTRTRMLRVESDLLGTLTVAEEEIVEFPQGLFGFPEARRFVVVPADREGVYWLQSTDHTPLAFLLADPFLHFEGYAVELGPGDLADLRAGADDTVAILAVVTLPASATESPTANLQGPVAIHFAARRAKQVAISTAEHGVRRAIDLSRSAA
jgi:flagellar assembly factor FliW